MNTGEFFLLLIVVIASAAGQILLRKGAAVWITDAGFVRFLKSFFKGPAPWALLLVLGVPFIYWHVLKTVPLSRAYAVTALTGVFVQIGGRLFLGERPGGRILLGALLCCAGIAVWGF